MKKYIDGTVCFLAAIIPMNIIFIVRFAVDYRTDWRWQNWAVVGILGMLVLVGILGHLVLNTDKTTPDKHQLGQRYIVKEIKDLTGEQYLTQFALFILTAFAIPYSLPWVDLGFIVFVELAICVVYINCNMFYVNPFFNLLGYKIYKASFYNERTTITETFYVFMKRAEILINQEINIKLSDSKIIRIKGKGGQ